MKMTKSRALLMVICLITLLIPLLTTGGTLFCDKEKISKANKWYGGDYDSLAIELVGPTAFADARDDIKLHEGDWFSSADNHFTKNMKAIVLGKDGNNPEKFGSVGIFVGPRGTSKNSDMWSILQSHVSIDEDQIKQFDQDITGSTEPGPFTKYKIFGGAIQKLNEKAMKSKGASVSIAPVIVSFCNVSMLLPNIFTKLYIKYDPAPVANGVIDVNKIDANAGTNELCKLIKNNPDAYGVFDTLGSHTMISTLPNSLVITLIVALVLSGISALMILINGRTAGEGMRKMIWKIGIALVGIPIFVNFSSFIMTGLDEMLTQQTENADNDFIRKNLDFADWYLTGFNLPSGVTLSISADGELLLSQEQIELINKYVHKKIHGTDDAASIEETIQNYYTQYKSSPMEISFSEPMTKETNPRPYKSQDYYKAMDEFGNNNDVTSVSGFKDIGYLKEVGLNMTRNDTNKTWEITTANKRFGISPLASVNLMQTSFTGAKMAHKNKDSMGSVVFNAYNTEDAGSGRMPLFIRFITTMAMTIAAVKGMIKVFASSLSGIIGGGVKTSLGSSQGFGQMIGGVVAIVVAILSTSLIISITMGLVDNVYDMIGNVFSTASHAIGYDKFRIVANMFGFMGLPILTDLLIGGIPKLILTIAALIFIPKLAKIPIQVVTTQLAELPGKFATRAQEIENRFTGDYRAGGHGGNSTMSLVSNMIHNASNQSMSQGHAVLAGAGTVASSVGGYALGQAGNKLAEKYGDGSSMSGSGEAPTGGEAESTDSNVSAPENTTLPENAVAPENDGETFNGANENNLPNSASENDSSEAPIIDTDNDSDDAERSSVAPVASAEGSNAAGQNGGTSPVIIGQSNGSMAGQTSGASESTTAGTEGNDISETSRESINNSDKEGNDIVENTEQDNSSDKSDLNETASMSENSTDGTASAESITSSDTSSSDSSMSDVDAVNDVSEMSEMSTMSDQASESDTKIDSHASASVANSNNNSVTKSGAPNATNAAVSGSATAMAGKTSTPTSGSKISNSQTVNNRASNQTMATGTSSNSSNTTVGGANVSSGGVNSNTSVNKGSANVNTQALTKEQKHARNMQALAKSLQAAGNNTTKGQMIAGVVAGTAHMAGGMVGAQHITQNGINAVHADKARRRDIAAGLDGNFTSRRQMRENAMNNIAKTMERHEVPVNNIDAYSDRTVSNTEYYAEELARQQYEDNIARRYDSNSDN